MVSLATAACCHGDPYTPLMGTHIPYTRHALKTDRLLFLCNIFYLIIVATIKILIYHLFLCALSHCRGQCFLFPTHYGNRKTCNPRTSQDIHSDARKWGYISWTSGLCRSEEIYMYDVFLKFSFLA